MSRTKAESEKANVNLDEFSFVGTFQLETDNSSYLHNVRTRALDAYRALPFPDTTTLGWRKISYQDLRTQEYRLPGESKSALEQPDLDLPDPYSKNVLKIQRVYAQDGSPFFVPQTLEKGITSGLTSDPSIRFPQKVIEKIGQIISPSSDKFTAFGFAFAQGIAVISIDEGVQVDAPIFYQEIYQGEKLAVPSTTMIYLAKNSSATLIRQQKSVESSDVFCVGVTEIFLEEGARLDILDLFTASPQTWDIQNQKAEVEKNATMNWFTLHTGSGFLKSHQQVDLTGQGSQALITGLFLPTGTQRFYMDTIQNHLAENTTSDLLYRGVVDGESQSIWQGMIYVDKKAFRTDGYQANHNLILSKTAKVDAIPGLEILTDDVRCSHGVTITNIDEEQLFYLKSRGISEPDGIELIVTGFIQKVLDRISSDVLKKMILEEFISRINKTML
ncbi:MAG: Fe-S cluster assembly protein SufD [Anaerolineaceae bacterium]